jgi:hypothetical protein
MLRSWDWFGIAVLVGWMVLAVFAVRDISRSWRRRRDRKVARVWLDQLFAYASAPEARLETTEEE